MLISKAPFTGACVTFLLLSGSAFCQKDLPQDTALKLIRVAQDGMAANYQQLGPVKAVYEYTIADRSVAEEQRIDSTSDPSNGNRTGSSTIKPISTRRLYLEMLKHDHISIEMRDGVDAVTQLLYRDGDRWTKYHPGRKRALIKSTAQLASLPQYDPRQAGLHLLKETYSDSLQFTPEELNQIQVRKSEKGDIEADIPWGKNGTQRAAFVFDPAIGFLPKRVTIVNDKGHVSRLSTLEYREDETVGAFILKKSVKKLFSPPVGAATLDTEQPVLFEEYTLIEFERLGETPDLQPPVFADGTHVSNIIERTGMTVGYEERP
jgi:hypothetical protein